MFQNISCMHAWTCMLISYQNPTTSILSDLCLILTQTPSLEKLVNRSTSHKHAWKSIRDNTKSSASQIVVLFIYYLLSWFVLFSLNKPTLSWSISIQRKVKIDLILVPKKWSYLGARSVERKRFFSNHSWELHANSLRFEGYNAK